MNAYAAAPGIADGRLSAMRRIGVAFPGDPANRATWSGTPSGVVRGLTECGVEVVPIRAEPDPLVRELARNAIAIRYLRPQRDARAAIKRARAAARASPALAWVNTRAVPRRIRDAGHLDGIVQIGTGYLMPRGIPVATFEDMTVRQVVTHPYLGWDALSKRAFAARVALQHKAYDQAIAVCLTSRWAAESVLNDYGVAPEKVHVVGVGRNHSPMDVERDWSVPHLLFVGIDWERKNGPAVLRAFARLREQIPAATLDVVGGHPPITQTGVTTHGILRLDVPEQHERVEQLFARATCFVMPSLAEASAIAYVEAAAAGLPSIGSSAGGSDYLIGDGGLIVDPHDDAGLLAAMRQLSDAPTAAAMGTAAKQRSELFTWPQVGRRLLEALEGRPASPLS